MRGGLDDALERLARMDQLRRRAESASGGLPTAHGLAEAIEAVRRVVERYPDLNITLYGEQGEGSAEVRIGWEDGLVRAKIVSVEGPETTGFGPGEGPTPALPAEIPPMTDLPRPLTDATRPRVDAYPAATRRPEPPHFAERSPAGRRAEPPTFAEPSPAARRAEPSSFAEPSPAARRAEPSSFAEPSPAARRAEPSSLGEPSPAARRAEPSPVPEPPRLVDPGLLADRRLRRPAQPEPPQVEEPSAPAPDLPRPAPRAWLADQEDASGAAARLAAMIREDPSLLASPDDR